MSSADRLPADARRSLRIYNLLLPFVFLALLPGLLRRMLRRGHFREKFGQRLALYTDVERFRFQSSQWVWIHSISVGETLIALKLARELRRHDLSIHVALSVTTSTGFALAREAPEEWLTVIYNPVDFPSIAREALDTIRPAQLILVEGEAWPNLVAECYRREVPVFLISARLSPRSERRFRRFRAFTSPIFRLLEKVCVPEQDDIARWVDLGVAPARIHCTGSIKFDHGGLEGVSRATEFRGLLGKLAVSPTAPILLGGSTWAPEESVLAKVTVQLRGANPELFLILVPRHVERVPEILRALEPLGLRIVRRSAIPASMAQPCDVLLVDTTGELRDWYALATVVFIGKSLAATGGQNPAEPAILGKPVVFGEHMENFAAIVEVLLAREAAVQVPDAEALAEVLQRLLGDAAYRERLGANARQALDVHQGATERTARLLLGE